MKITDILKKLRELAANSADQGTLFERFITQYLRATRIYGEFKEIWRWSDWPLNQEQHDTGIDLVALTESGEYWAFQCKFFDPNSKVSKQDIDSFLSASAVNFTDEEGKTRTFSARYVVATCEISSNAYQTMNAQTIPANFISAEQFDLSGINWDIFWDQFTEQASGTVQDARVAPKELRPHQQRAFNDVLHGFETCERGKLIMACGTGKTFTSLRIAEGSVPEGGVMLYLVPSLSLLGQTLCAWTIDAKRTLRPILVCSDTSINEQDSRKKKALKDSEDQTLLSVSDLAQPASTNPEAIMRRWERLRGKKDGFTVVFSTYQSIQAVADAQKMGFPEFDLIVCDEAHRTTGSALSDTDDVSAFMRVHDNGSVAGKKRLYMTATPRVYGEGAKKSAKDQTDGAVVIASMDDESIYGPVFHELKFGEAVKQGLLADYKVIILAVRESLASEYRKQITDETRTTYRTTYPKLKKAEDDEIDELILSDFAKVIGCWQGLAKQGGSLDAKGKTSFDFSADPAPMRRAVAFAQSISISKNIVTDLFHSVSDFVEDIQNKKRAEDPSFEEPRLKMTLKHVDGTNSANERKKFLDWLANEPEEETCRVLTNVRCLSEGVDVPALDAVLFLSPRNSKVDIIQSVGRVMRNAPGKKYGYIILPIAIPEQADPEAILNKNERFKVVWEVLQALRSHDERIRIEINKIRFNDMKSGDAYDPNDPSKGTVGTGSAPDSSEDEANVDLPQPSADSYQFKILFQGMEEMKDRIRAKVVQKCGDRDYLDESAKIIAEIAKIHIDQIRAQLDELDPERKAAFDEFAARLRQDLNPSIDTEQVFDMISQHLVTQPVFDALFGDYPFAKKNVVSQAFERLLSIFKTQSSEEEWKALERVREDIRSRVEGITSLSGKQQVIYKIYEQFFKVAAKKTAEKLGIVYTPVEVVDFIIHSVEYILKTEFGKSMSNRNVHILDPFTGTGTFIVRLLESGILDPDSPNFAYKFNNELHANELVLLAYYIAAINIEQTFFSVGMRKKYQSFPGLLLTDTFQTGEKELPAEQNENSLTFPKNVIGEEDIEHFENDKRIIRQRRQTIQVILGNPPYSVGQGSANDNNQNQKYPKLDARIAETYAKQSTAVLKNSLYDSYIKAFRWASDRIGDSGVIGFVTNGGWLDGNSQDGLRKCFANEFSSVYVFNLRGNARSSGELRRKEAGNIFGEGTRTPVAITILVKNPQKAGKLCEIFYHDIGDYLKREDKLRIVHDFHDISFISFQTITPNAEGDWL
ncbi:MAG: DEAD/DEAH box helicase, partial [Thermoguttaceae bacterium]|nr:DEAD/DEAH box helicase [Thermoguttaceae bacterium]